MPAGVVDLGMQGSCWMAVPAQAPACQGLRNISLRTCFTLQRPRLHNRVLLLEAVAGRPVPEPQAAIVGACRQGRSRNMAVGGDAELRPSPLHQVRDQAATSCCILSPLAITPSWLTAMQLTIACRGNDEHVES